MYALINTLVNLFGHLINCIYCFFFVLVIGLPTGAGVFFRSAGVIENIINLGPVVVCAGSLALAV